MNHYIPKKIMVYILMLMLLLGGFMPSHADLAAADTSPGTKYKARCGSMLKSCTVSFSEDQLIIGTTGKLSRNKFSGIVTNRTCRQRSILLPMFRSCFESQFDHDITVNYTGDDGTRKSALIVFRPGYLLQGEEAYSNFFRELQIWMKVVVRPVGPSIEVQHVNK